MPQMLPLRLIFQQSKEAMGCTNPIINKLVCFLEACTYLSASRLVLYMDNIPDPKILELVSKESRLFLCHPSLMLKE